MAAEISTQTVMSAIHEMHRRHGGWPTAEVIATYLKVPPDEVRRHLRDLKRRRLYDNRQRNRKSVWMPWEKAN